MTYEPTGLLSPAKPRGKPFPRYCDRCRKKTVRPATVDYRATIGHDDQLHSVHVSQLVVPQCTECGERYFDNDANEQIYQALRTQLHLLTPEQIRTNRLALNLSPQELADRLGVAETLLEDWEAGLQIQSRAMDNLLRLYFASPQVRSFLKSVEQHPELGASVVS